MGYIRSNHYLTSIVTPIINQYAQNVIIKGKIHDINFYQRNNRTMERIIVKTDNMPSKYIRINLKEQDIVQYG
ncbi:MAG: hypothetical protein LBT02_01440, partial [Rickettsiales bacterium]|nr:hypothetical protein [Rickettsiales bacterium]